MNFSQFLEDDNGKPSLSQLLKLAAFPFSTYVLLSLASENAMMIYITAFVTDSLLSKITNATKEVKMRGKDVGRDAKNSQ